MNGAFLEVVRQGNYDQFMTPPGEAEIMPFYMKINKYDKFGMSNVEVQQSGNFDFGGRIQYQLQPAGDIVSNIVLEVTLPEITTSVGRIAWINNIGRYIMKTLEFKVATATLQKFEDIIMDIEDRFTLSKNHEEAYNLQMGKTNEYVMKAPRALIVKTTYDSLQELKTTTSEQKLYIQLPFWFTKHWELALPTCAIAFNQMNIEFTLKKLEELLFFEGGASINTIGSPKIVEAKLWAETIIFEKSVRNFFVKTELYYPIVQFENAIQKGVSAETESLDIPTKLPVTELYAVVREDAATLAKCYDWFDQYTGNTISYEPRPAFAEITLYYGSIKKEETRTWHHYCVGNPMFYHTRSYGDCRSIACIPFTINPEDVYPYGTVNFGRLNQPRMAFKFNNISSSNPGVLTIYAKSINFFRILNGWSQVRFQ